MGHLALIPQDQFDPRIHELLEDYEPEDEFDNEYGEEYLDFADDKPKKRRKRMSKIVNPVAKIGDDIGSQIVTYGGFALLVYGAWVGYIYWRSKKLTLTPWKALPAPNIEGRQLRLTNGGKPPWFEEESQTFVTAAPDVAPPPMPRGRGEERVAMILP